MKVSRALLFVVLLSGAGPSAQQPPQVARPMQADGVVRLLADLEAALAANSIEGFQRLTASTISPAERVQFSSTSFGAGQDFASVRERDRRPVGAGFEVLVEMLIGRGRIGRIATWQLTVQPNPSTSAFEIATATAIAAVDGLVRLDLDEARQFNVHDLTFTAPGLTVNLESGVAFLARVADGPTALVFRGKGEMRFAPANAAEQVQIRAFSGKPTLESPIDALLLRLSPHEFTARIASGQLTPVDVHPGHLARARDMFEEIGRRSYTLNLGDLTTDRWSLLPPVGDVLAELMTRRHGTLTYVRSGDDAEDVSLFDRRRGRNISVYASPERLATRGQFYSEDDGTSYDVEHYALDVKFDPERDWVSGRGSLRIRTKLDGVATLSLKLAESLSVSSVSSPELGRVLALRVAGQSGVLISLPASLPRGTRLQLDVYYSGRLPAQAIEREAILVEAAPQAQPNPQALPELIIPPEPRYLYSNRTYWYPQASVTDFATAALQVTVPAQFQVVASGTLLNSTVTPIAEGSGRSGDSRAERTVQYLADRPLRYLACIISRFIPIASSQVAVPAIAPPGAAALANAANDPARSLTVDVVATPRLQRGTRALPERASDIIGYYARTVGEAPYPNFTVATLDATLPSGHSPAYFAVWNQATLPTTLSWRDDPVALDGPSYFFLAHEIAHQWFGQAIGWKNYHEQWLSEGLSQFYAAMYASQERGGNTEHELFSQMRSSAMDLARHGPVYLGYRLGHIQGDGRIFRGLVYNKSAVVLHMLRRLIGAEAFDRGIQRFYLTNRFNKAGTDDLRAAFESEAGVPLTRFFERWILGFSHPEARLSWRVEPDDTHVHIRVDQTGDVFDFPLTVTINYTSGQSEQVTLRVTSASHEVRVPLTGRVRQVETRHDLSLVNVRR